MSTFPGLVSSGSRNFPFNVLVGYSLLLSIMETLFLSGTTPPSSRWMVSGCYLMIRRFLSLPLS
jgi:hypothetical protein